MYLSSYGFDPRCIPLWKNEEDFLWFPLFLAQKLPSEEPILDSESGECLKLGLSAPFKLAICYDYVKVRFHTP
jgi:hypothetical protein